MFNKKATNISLSGLAIVVSMGLYSQISMADESGDIIKYRQNVMKGIAADSRMMNAILKGKMTNDADLKPLAASLAAKSKMLKANFPDGSDFGETDAKEQIWENKDDFNAKADAFEKASHELLQVLQQNSPKNIVLEKYSGVGKSCKSCHKKYREK